ncbi:argininosuccinate lyase [Falsibacillus pallidus]|uniref:Argininosuccinate lyase n=1 Tax=Falsibacillus pallidus TaxID=493781 RepID=A0A370GA18_9BACI|nr:argininosuccinate lyase [Falsibacillus pallidus]RDI40040.1 argininosuccinate lyase [Falsibacillus pallidus]
MKGQDDFLLEEGSVFPGKTYVESVLKPVFEDQRDYLFEAMFDIHCAHVIMLSEQGILKKEEAAIMLRGIQKTAEIDPASLFYNPKFEDLFFMMEAKIAEEIGGELAGKIHMGRSRNDMGVAMYRLVLREKLLSTIDAANALSDALLNQAEHHTETYMTGYTHTQPAQPTTLSHYFLAIYDVLQRDIARLWSAFEQVNQSPLGAAALTTTGFPISRARTCELLGFRQVIENAYDAIAGADYLLESASSIMVLMVDTGRWINDFLQYVTREYGAFKVAEPYVQVSSIMPQKRNPVSIEHARSLASSAYSDAFAAMNMIHNTPFGDIVDTEDDLQPHLYRAADKAVRVLTLMRAVIATLKVDGKKLMEGASKSCITITELADTLARDHDISFRKAHSIASAIAIRSAAEGKELYEWKVSEINMIIQEFRVGISLEKEQWERIISPKYFVKIRSIQGGPAPVEVKRMIEERMCALERCCEKWRSTKEWLVNNQKELRTKSL